MTPALTMPEAAELNAYLRVLAGADAAGRLLEIRYTTGQGEMTRRFVPAHDLARAARLIAALAHGTDVYTGVLLRNRRSGGRDAVSRSHLVFIETDDGEASEQLARFRHPPTLLIASGSPRHLHAYWRLQHPVDVDALEQANRRLAHHLGGDLASVDAARVLRPPATLNHKHDPPAAVRILQLNRDRCYTLTALTAGLTGPSPRPRSASRPARAGTSELDGELLSIPAASYVPALTGRQPNRAGKIQCPFHEDHTPSLQLYDKDWYCFGACRAGGSIYNFGALLYGLGTRGREFLELRRRLAADLQLTMPRVTARPVLARAHGVRSARR